MRSAPNRLIIVVGAIVLLLVIVVAVVGINHLRSEQENAAIINAVNPGGKAFLDTEPLTYSIDRVGPDKAVVTVFDKGSLVVKEEADRDDTGKWQDGGTIALP